MKSYFSKNSKIFRMYNNSLGFKDGVLSYVLIQTTIDIENPDYYEFIAFFIDEIGTVTIEIPEYTIVE